MSGCISIEKSEGFANMESSNVMPRKRFSFRNCTLSGFFIVLGITLAIAMSIAGFLMAAYSVSKTSEVSRLQKLSDIFLTSDVSNLPATYSSYPLAVGTGYWAQKANLAYARSDFGAQPYGNKIIIFGGSGNGSVTMQLNATVAYDITSNKLTKLADMPVALSRFAHAILNDSIYIFGGTTNYDGNSCVNSAYQYNITSDTWFTLRNLPNTIIDSAATVGSDGKIYIAGGYVAPDYTILDTVYQFDPTSMSFATLSASLNTPRGDLRVVSVGTKIYAIGGFNWILYPNATALSSVEAMDLSVLPRAWSYVTPMSKGRGDFAAGVLNGSRIIVAGGEVDLGDGLGTQYATDAVEVYMVDNDQWLDKALLPEARFRHEGAVVNGDHFYAMGGTQTCVLNNENKCYDFGLKSVFEFLAVDSPLVYVVYRTSAIAKRMARRLMMSL